MTYQSFGDERGDSNSAEKLDRLLLPALHGKSFLDVGCNEGFFCMAARDRGAISVTGIDSNPLFIRRARERAPSITYLEQSWDTLPDGPFDVVLLASALHYASHPRRLLSEISRVLSDDGLFILEAGVVENHSRDKMWMEVKRGGDLVTFPNLALLSEELLSDFAVRVVGHSVRQSGDPVGRLVFHCQKFHPIVMLCSGPSGMGKTTLGVEFDRKSVLRFSTDVALMNIAHNSLSPSSKLYSLIRENFRNDQIGRLIGEINQLGMGADLANALFKMFPRGERISVVEGYALYSDEVRETFISLLKKERYRVWLLSSG